MIRNSSPASRYSCKHSLSSRESDLRDPCQPTAYYAQKPRAETEEKACSSERATQLGTQCQDLGRMFALAGIAEIFCRCRDDPAAANPAIPLLTCVLARTHKRCHCGALERVGSLWRVYPVHGLCEQRRSL